MTFTESLISLEIGLIYAMIAIGIYFSFRTINFADLTCDGSFVSGAAASTMLLKMGINPWIALLGAILAGALAGIITGLLATYGKISQLLSGILVAFMLYSINLKLMRGTPNITLINEITIFSGKYIPSAVILLAIAALVWFLSSYFLTTDFGLGLRSIGQNTRLAILGGINISTMTIFGVAVSNALIGLGGGLFSQHQGFTDISQGVGTLIYGLAAIMIGEKLFPLRSMWFSIFACIAGSITYRFIVALALHNEWFLLQTSDLNLITGLMIVLIMFVPKLEKRLSC